MKAKHFLLITSLAFILACTYFGLKGIQGYQEYKKRDAIALKNISANLNVAADWSIVRNEIYCNRMPLGISLEEIEQGIGNATPIMIERTHDIYLYYDLYFLNPDIKLRKMFLAFDNEHRLKEKLIWAGFGETMAVQCT
jgi:hypothetical protein